MDTQFLPTTLPPASSHGMTAGPSSNEGGSSPEPLLFPRGFLASMLEPADTNLYQQLLPERRDATLSSPPPLNVAPHDPADSSTPGSVHSSPSSMSLSPNEPMPPHIDSRVIANGIVASMAPETAADYKIPITEIVEGGEKLFYCHLCNFFGTSLEQLREHLATHQEHRCTQCDYTSRTEGRLKQHVQKFHSPVTQVGPPQPGPSNIGDTPTDNLALTSPLNAPSTSKGVTASKPTRPPGRRKVYRCKQCDYTISNKHEFWDHMRCHIKKEKQLECIKCNFVTEYKHHLEYHLRNHFGSKPFKCTKCNYSCVNKSMLNSHMKSHTNLYQYRCADCNYVSKYCHSLKLHVNKYSHKPSPIINLDGTIEHDVSSLLTMKKSGPKSGKPRANKKVTASQRNTPASIQSSPTSSHHRSPRLPIPQPPTMPGVSGFWPHRFGGDVRGPPPLLPMQNYLAGLMTPRPRHHTITSEEQSNPLPPTFKCDKCIFEATSKEALDGHKASCHGGASSNMSNMFNMLGGFGVNRRENTMPMPVNPMWPRAGMFGFNNAMAQALSLPPFLPPNVNAMHLGFGFNRPPMPSTPPQSMAADMRSPRASYPEIAAPCRTRCVTTALASLNVGATPEKPLDLTKSIPVECGNAQLNGSRKRSRKSKAFKLEALCQRLQKKMDPIDPQAVDEQVSEELVVAPSSSNHSSPMAETVHDYPSPTESFVNGEASDTTSGGESTKVFRSEPNNNDHIVERCKKRNSMDDRANNNDTESSKAVRTSDSSAIEKERFTCIHCDLSFGSCAMYTIHMGYHGFHNPFICNLCGTVTENKVSFFCHIARNAHH